MGFHVLKLSPPPRSARLASRLEAEIADACAHPSIDNLQIVELKRRKLLVKDEIARLQN